MNITKLQSLCIIGSYQKKMHICQATYGPPLLLHYMTYRILYYIKQELQQDTILLYRAHYLFLRLEIYVVHVN